MIPTESASLPAPSSAEGGRAAVRRHPERTRERILRAAIVEFTAKGLSGARVDQIARRAGANKRMLYHYFGGKQDLFLAVLERIYDDIRRAEAELHLEELDPETAMRRLVGFSFDYCRDNPPFIHLLNSENLHGARHLRRSSRIREMHSPLIALIGRLLRRGAAVGRFRKRVDPVQLYISIAALGFFYFSNIHTLSTVFGRDLSNVPAIEERRRHAEDVILGYLRP